MLSNRGVFLHLNLAERMKQSACVRDRREWAFIVSCFFIVDWRCDVILHVKAGS